MIDRSFGIVLRAMSEVAVVDQMKSILGHLHPAREEQDGQNKGKEPDGCSGGWGHLERLAALCQRDNGGGLTKAQVLQGVDFGLGRCRRLPFARRTAQASKYCQSK